MSQTPNPSVERLIERLLNIFGEPRCDDPAGYLQELRDSLGKYAPDLLVVAGDRARDDCKFFPRPAELREFIGAEIALRNIGRPRNLFPTEAELPPPSPEAVARAAALVREATEVMLKRGKEAMGVDDEPLPDVSKPAFEKMQRESPNKHLHMAGPNDPRPVGLADTELMKAHAARVAEVKEEQRRSLTERSRRMSGDEIQ